MIHSLLSIILLTVALVNILIYQRTTQELTRILTVTLAMVGLIWGLAIAPWSIQLLALVLLLRFRLVSRFLIFEPINLN